MSDNLEASLRAALGLPDAEPDTLQTDEPDAPLALNDDNGLRAIIMGELHNHASNTARREQNENVLHQMIHTIQN